MYVTDPTRGTIYTEITSKTQASVDFFRNRLNSRLHLEDYPVTLFSAPKSYDKRRILHGWLDAHTYAHLWLTMSEKDKDLAFLYDHFCQTVGPNSHLDSIDTGADSKILSLLNNLAVANHAPYIVVLDARDVEIEDGWLQYLQHCVEHLHPDLHIVLVSDLQFKQSISYLEIQEAVHFVGPAEIGMTFDELCEYVLSNIYDLPRRNLLSIYLCTEGWPSGVRLILQYCHVNRWPKTAHQFVRDIPHIYDFFISEIFQKQPEHIQEFLMQTSCLDHLSAPLCNYALGRTDSAEIIDYLIRHNVFLFPIDQNHMWYRYHGLFKEALMLKASTHISDQLPQLYQKYSDWYKERCQWSQALRFAYRADDETRIAALLPGAFSTFRGTSDCRNVFQLLWQKDFQRYLSEPQLCILSAMHSYYSGNIQALDQAQEKWATFSTNNDISNEEFHAVTLYMQAIHLYIAISTRAEPMEKLQKDGRALYEECASFPYLQAMMLLANGVLLEHSAPEKSLLYHRKASKIAKDLGQDVLLAYLTLRIAKIYYRMGRLEKAATICRSGMSDTISEDIEDGLMFSSIYILYAQILCELNQTRDSIRYVQKAVDLLRNETTPSIRPHVILSAAKIFISTKDYSRASLFLKISEEIFYEEQAFVYNRSMLDQIACIQADLNIRQGRIRSAQEWAEKVISRSDNLNAIPINALQILILLNLVTQQHEKIPPLLSAAFRSTPKTASMTHIIQIHILATFYYDQIGETALAAEHFLTAIYFAVDEGCRSVFNNFGPAMHDLIQKFLAKNITTDAHYIQFMRSILAEDPETASVAIRKTVLEESPLSDTPAVLPINLLTSRELAVLRLLGKGLSNKEISKELMISENTTKKHLKSIFGKLNVSNRTQALWAAQRLNLL